MEILRLELSLNASNKIKMTLLDFSNTEWIEHMQTFMEYEQETAIMNSWRKLLETVLMMIRLFINQTKIYI